MRVAIANVGAPSLRPPGVSASWADHRLPPPRAQRRLRLHEQAWDWGFHIMALGVYMLDRRLADRVEFWDYADHRECFYLANGILRMTFFDEDDVEAYLAHSGDPDLFVNHGSTGRALLDRLAGRCFRVSVPALRPAPAPARNEGGECYLVDEVEQLDERSMIYVPVVNTWALARPALPKVRDFVYLASVYGGKRHDLLLDAVRGTGLTGHLHPVKPGELDLRGTRVTTSAFDERDVVELLLTSRIAVYPGDNTSSPAAMWECVAAGLPIVVNADIRGGKHLVVPGVTGELAAPGDFREAMEHVLATRHAYRPREYFAEQWDTIAWTERYLAFFRAMGWDG
jgi:hypothetical protein